MYRLLLILMLLSLTCGKNPADYKASSQPTSGKGKLEIVCKYSPSINAKEASTTARAEILLWETNDSEPIIFPLAREGTTGVFSGALEVFPTTYWQVIMAGYDKENNTTYAGNATNVVVKSGETTRVEITLLKNNNSISLAIIEDKESPFAAFVSYTGGDGFGLIGDKDDAGKTTKITGVAYTPASGGIYYLWFGPDGLPEILVSKKWSIRFFNYTDSTVDICYITPDGIRYYAKNIPIDRGKLNQLKLLISGGLGKAAGLNKETWEVPGTHLFFNSSVEAGICRGATALNTIGNVGLDGITFFSDGSLVSITGTIASVAGSSTLIDILKTIYWAKGDDISKVFALAGADSPMYLSNVKVEIFPEMNNLTGVYNVIHSNYVTYRNRYASIKAGDCIAPLSPSALHANIVSSSQIDLYWDWAGISESDGRFCVEMSVNGGKFSEIARIGTEVKNYSATHLMGNSLYIFRIRAYKPNDYSSYSNSVTIELEYDTPTINGITFVSIPGGTFLMGNVENESYGIGDETPVHTVTLSSFKMSTCEITYAQYARFLNDASMTGDVTVSSSTVIGVNGAYNGKTYINLGGASDFYYKDSKCWITFNSEKEMFTVAEGKENFPVAWVTWYGAKVFALYYGWDLPTEAEWEYACRGGKQYKYGTNDGNIEPSQANYGHNSSNAGARAVGSYYPNPFGLYDMCGNVCEFCHDAWSQYKEGNFVNPVSPEDNRRVCRGGSFDNSIDNCRSSSRSATGINTCWRSSGFRVVHRANNYHY